MTANLPRRRAAKAPRGTEIKKRTFKRGTYFDLFYERPDTGKRVKYPVNFNTRGEALVMANQIMQTINRGEWISPEERETMDTRNQTTLNDYFERYLRVHNVAPSTEVQYRSIWNQRVKETLGKLPIKKITSDDILEWYSTMATEYETPKRTADTYKEVASVFSLAYEDHLIDRSPCEIKGAGRAPEPDQKPLITQEQLQVIYEHLPKHYKLAALVAGYGALRIGEWAGLERRDVIVTPGAPEQCPLVQVFIRRAAKVNKGANKINSLPPVYLGETKTKKQRKVTLPGWLGVQLIEWLDSMEDKSAEAILFPNADGELTCSRSFNKIMKRAGRFAGRGDVSSHDLRHFGGTLFSQSGATMAETMHRLGHSTTGAAMRYQHATMDRDRAIAERMTFDMPDGVVSLDKKRKEKQSEKKEGLNHA